MIAKIILLSDTKRRIEYLDEQLSLEGLKREHPDVLYFDSEQKLGIEQARQMKDHFMLKPYSAKGRAVVIEDLSGITVDAQNALLKIVEEPPTEAILLFGTTTVDHLLPTFLSRCQIIEMISDKREADLQELEKILRLGLEGRFKAVEKHTDKEQLFQLIVQYTEKELIKNPAFFRIAKEVLELEQWQKARVNLRGILEYLMLILPKI